MLIRRLTVSLALAGVALLGAATPAFAHAELTGSTPARGASLDTAPTELKLTFNEPVSPVSITVTGPQGAQWTVGQIAVQGNDVTAPVQASGPPGQYAIAYKVKSDDGDDVTGSVAFTMTAASPPTSPSTSTSSSTSTSAAAPSASPGTPGTQAASGSGGGVPAWVWIVIVVAVLVAAAGLVVTLRTRRRAESPPER